MNHLEFEKYGKRYCLTGSVITVFLDNGFKLRQLFYHDNEQARQAFLRASKLTF